MCFRLRKREKKEGEKCVDSETVCVRERLFVCLCICVSVCLCVIERGERELLCVCVSVWERERRKRVFVCVCVWEDWKSINFKALILWWATVIVHQIANELGFCIWFTMYNLFSPTKLCQHSTWNYAQILNHTLYTPYTKESSVNLLAYIKAAQKMMVKSTLDTHTHTHTYTHTCDDEGNISWKMHLSEFKMIRATSKKHFFRCW